MGTKISAPLSAKIGNLNLFATLCICIMHMSKTQWATTPSRILDIVLSMAMPTFFLLSGYLLVGHCDTTKPFGGDFLKKALKKRVSTLLISYIILSIFWFICKYAFHKIGVIYWGCEDTITIDALTPLSVLGLTPPTLPGLGVMWYIRMLFIFIIVSPLLIEIMRHGKTMAFLTVLALLVTTIILGIKFPESPTTKDLTTLHLTWTFRPSGFLFFALGIALRFYWNGNMTLSFAIGAGIIFVLGHIFPIVPYFGYILPLLLISFLFGILPATPAPSILYRNPFAIYVIHPMVTYGANLVCKACHLMNWYGTYSSTIVEFSLSVIIAVLIAETLRRKSPKWHQLLLGGR